MHTLRTCPIEYSDLRYTITKLCFKSGIEYAEDFRGDVVLGEPVTFYMRCPIVVLARERDGDALTDVCYHIVHQPTKELSPIFHHVFKSEALFGGSGKYWIGPMKLNPAEGVWPELTRKGWYGELPQFYT